MTDVLARIRVREMHGIRRFLYPLLTWFNLPIETDTDSLRLVTQSGEAVPSEVVFIDRYTAVEDHYDFVLGFAISLDPFSDTELTLVNDGRSFMLHDPLRVTDRQDGGVDNTQNRFSISLGAEGPIERVIYDGVEHLRLPSRITRNGLTAQMTPLRPGHRSDLTASERLSASVLADGKYSEDVLGFTRCDLTACKSWVTVTHTLIRPKIGDVVTFTLPLTVTALPLLCDFGIGGGIYGKIGAGDTVIWETQFTESGGAWTLATNGRTDYLGEVGSREEYQAQQWFHVIDKGKALAVAITNTPRARHTMTITLTSVGDVQIAFTLGGTDNNSVEFAVCHHFLNDAPAIAAATNPQSILLPPTVEVLPAD